MILRKCYFTFIFKSITTLFTNIQIRFKCLQNFKKLYLYHLINNNVHILFAMEPLSFFLFTLSSVYIIVYNSTIISSLYQLYICIYIISKPIHQLISPCKVIVKGHLMTITQLHLQLTNAIIAQLTYMVSHIIPQASSASSYKCHNSSVFLLFSVLLTQVIIRLYYWSSFAISAQIISSSSHKDYTASSASHADYAKKNQIKNKLFFVTNFCKWIFWSD